MVTNLMCSINELLHYYFVLMKYEIFNSNDNSKIRNKEETKQFLPIFLSLKCNRSLLVCFEIRVDLYLDWCTMLKY